MSFEFQGESVRSTCEDGELMFVAKDVFERLGMKWSIRRLEMIPAAWRNQCKIASVEGGRQVSREMWLINEPAFYKIVYSSNHPDANAFIEKASEFTSKMRRGVETQTDIEEFREMVQMTLFDLAEIRPQKATNHQKNMMKDSGRHNSQFWEETYQLLFEKSYRQVAAEQVKRGCPEYIARISGQDALRYFEDTYGMAMAGAARSKFFLDGMTSDRADGIIKGFQPFFEEVGKFYGEKHAYEHTRTTRKNEDQLELCLDNDHR